MMEDCVSFSNLFGNFNKFVDHKYKLSEDVFVRDRKFNLESAIKYPICNRKKTTSIEVNRFIRNVLGDNTMTITKQAVSDKMQYIDPRAYIDMNDEALNDLYHKEGDTRNFKGCNVFAIDASFVELPNMPLTREEFGIDESKLYGKHTTTARISTMVDVYRDFIVNAKIGFRKTNEKQYALQHLDEVENVIELENSIVLYDRGYPHLEIMVQHFYKGSYFLIRAKKNSLEKYQRFMTENNLTDETFNVRLNSTRLKHFKKPELKDYAREIISMNVRIVKVILKNGTEETLLTNIPEELASPLELKELYFKRWKIETNYDRLKNKCMIEKFSGRKKIRIEQEFYSDILVFNLLIAIKNDANNKINVKPKEKAKYKYIYQPNINILIGEIKELMPKLLTDNQEEIDTILKSIINIGTTHLVSTKIKTTTENERPKDRNYNKKCKSNLKESF